MSIENIKNFIIKNKVIVVICIIIIIGFLYADKNENLDNNNSVNTVKTLDLSGNKILPINKSQDNKILYNPISIYDDMLVYIDDKFKINYINLDLNGAPEGKFNKCGEGILLTVGLSGDSGISNILYGVGSDNDLYYLPIRNKFIDCKAGWGKLGDLTINEITPVDGGCWITNTDSTQRIYKIGGISDNKTIALLDRVRGGSWSLKSDNIKRGKLKYDRVTKKLWGLNSTELKFSKSKDVLSNAFDESVTYIVKSIKTYSGVYDVYNNKLFLILANTFNGKEKYNIFYYDELPIISEYETGTTHNLLPLQFIEGAKDVCVTQNYAFIVAEKNILGKIERELYRLDLTAKDGKFTKYISLDKDVQKLYSHPLCLYILFTDSTIGYIQLGTNKTREALLEDNKKLSDEKTNLEKQKTALETEKTNLQNQNTTLATEQTKLLDSIKKLDSGNTDLQKQKTDLVTEKTNLQKQNTELNNKVKELEEKEKNRVPCKTQFENNFSKFFNYKKEQLGCKCNNTIESNPLKL